MSTAKAMIIDELDSISDNITDEIEILDNLYHRIRIKKGRESILNEGGLSTADVRAFFEQKRNKA